MQIQLRPLSTPGDSPPPFLGKVVLEGGHSRVEVADPALQKRLAEFFNSPLRVAKAMPGASEGIHAHTVVTVPPNTPEHFREAVYLLDAFGLEGVLEP